MSPYSHVEELIVTAGIAVGAFVFALGLVAGLLQAIAG